MRPLQSLLCFLFCTAIFMVFGLGMRQLAAEGHVRTEFTTARPDPAPPAHTIVAGAFVDRHAGEAVALAERLAEADKALHEPGGTRQQIQDARAEYYNDLCMLHLLAARSPRTGIPDAAQSRMRATPMEQACGEP